MRRFLFPFVLLCSILIVACNRVPESARTTTFKVWGNCGMCKKTIESSLYGKEGIIAADWNVDTKIISVQYDTLKTSVPAIQQLIAGAGYDNEGVRADSAVYAGLHHCCQYERRPE